VLSAAFDGAAPPTSLADEEVATAAGVWPPKGLSIAGAAPGIGVAEVGGGGAGVLATVGGRDITADFLRSISVEGALQLYKQIVAEVGRLVGWWWWQ
jgi:hypothetical protein